MLQSSWLPWMWYGQHSGITYTFSTRRDPVRVTQFLLYWWYLEQGSCYRISFLFIFLGCYIITPKISTKGIKWHNLAMLYWLTRWQVTEKLRSKSIWLVGTATQDYCNPHVPLATCQESEAIYQIASSNVLEKHWRWSSLCLVICASWLCNKFLLDEWKLADDRKQKPQHVAHCSCNAKGI